VYIVPIRAGGGTRLKIFEACAMGKAVVSTTVGAEGLPLLHERHFLRADDPKGFARAVIRLLEDPACRRRLGAASRDLVLKRHAWPQVTAAFMSRCEQVPPGQVQALNIIQGRYPQ
jgi:glycosyltransferase involved in cell wall biosynthesis